MSEVKESWSAEGKNVTVMASKSRDSKGKSIAEGKES